MSGPDARVLGGDYSHDAIDLGLGLRPDLTGHGRGRDLVAAVLDRVSEVLANPTLPVTIAAFNIRAIRVWEAAGFAITCRFLRPGDGRFSSSSRGPRRDEPATISSGGGQRRGRQARLDLV